MSTSSRIRRRQSKPTNHQSVNGDSISSRAYWTKLTELARDRIILIHDFETFQYAFQLSLHMSYMDMEAWQSHVSEALSNLLPREAQTRPSAQQPFGRLVGMNCIWIERSYSICPCYRFVRCAGSQNSVKRG